MEPLADSRVRANEAYLPILLLSRVVLRLGSLAPVPPSIIEQLFAADFVYLQELYVRANDAGGEVIETECPRCGERFALDLAAGGAEEG